MNRRQQVLSWWQGRERREQWMLAVMGACLLAFVYWYALMLPLRALRDEALAGRQRAGADLALVQARLQALQVQQQLGAQALSIANSQPQVILQLFKG